MRPSTSLKGGKFEGGGATRRIAPRVGLRALPLLWAIAILVLPLAWVMADDGVGNDGMPGSLPSRKGGPGVFLSYVTGGVFGPSTSTSSWNTFPSMAQGAMVFRGSSIPTIDACIPHVASPGRRHEAGLIPEVGLAYESPSASPMTVTLDVAALALANVSTYAWLPPTFQNCLVYCVDQYGQPLFAPLQAVGQYQFEIHISRMASLLSAAGGRIEIGFVDGPSGGCLRMRFEMSGSLMRVETLTL